MWINIIRHFYGNIELAIDVYKENYTPIYIETALRKSCCLFPLTISNEVLMLSCLFHVFLSIFSCIYVLCNDLGADIILLLEVSFV